MLILIYETSVIKIVGMSRAAKILFLLILGTKPRLLGEADSSFLQLEVDVDQRTQSSDRLSGSFNITITQGHAYLEGLRSQRGCDAL